MKTFKIYIKKKKPIAVNDKNVAFHKKKYINIHN